MTYKELSGSQLATMLLVLKFSRSLWKSYYAMVYAKVEVNLKAQERVLFNDAGVTSDYLL
jgi:hypothetical protein